ncbi:MAG: hypothetical protein JSR26_08870 [Proteobacteria bacterium]|nr:hypothetical protein [Pseudomonadota bacterium]
MIDSTAYLLTCMRYIELNPVRAGMVAHPSEYRRSSHAANAQGGDDALVIAHAEYRALGRSAGERQSAYRQLFRSRLGANALSEIRNATNKAWVLGGDRFKRRVQRQLERRLEPAPRGGDRKSARYKKNASATINRV